MKNLIRQLLFRSVLMLIALHTLIPHSHYDEMSDEAHFELHKNNNNLFNLVQLFFHENDDTTLDNLVIAQFDIEIEQNSNSFSTLEIAKITHQGRDCINQKSFKKEHNNFVNNVFVKLNGLRGPPSLHLT